jgi:hypothetical protein
MTLHESLTDVFEAPQQPVNHVLCRLLVEALLPFIDHHDPPFDGRRFEEALVDPGIR